MIPTVLIIVSWSFLELSNGIQGEHYFSIGCVAAPCRFSVTCGFRACPCCVKEKFLVSLRAGHTAGADALHLQPGGGRRLANAFDGALVQRRFAHDPAAADVSAIEFKLRLH